jgi:DNA-binding GntR family transcriptional regulator
VKGNEITTVATHVADQIRTMILDHRLKPNEPLLQDKIAQELGTSRIPVREALRLLENEGLVVIRSHSSARVAQMDFAECVEIYKIRQRIEPLALQESIAHLSNAQIKNVISLAESLAAPDSIGAVWLERDRLFHLGTYAGITSPRLLNLITNYWNSTQHYRRAVVSTFTELDHQIAFCEHTLLVDAVKTQNADVGEDILRIHIARAGRRLSNNSELFDWVAS